MTDHITLGELRAWIERHADLSDRTEVRLYLNHGDDYDPSYGVISATLDSPEEDGEPRYLAFDIHDTGALS
jgi:hypothetical protein